MQALVKLKSEERKQVENLITRIQTSGITPGMREHVIQTGKRCFTSLSPNMDLRILAWRENDALTLLYVDHHDAAYEWAKQNSLKIVAAEIVSFEGDIGEGNSAPFEKYIHSEAIETLYSTQLQQKLGSFGIPTALIRLLEVATSDEHLIDLLELVAPEWVELVLDAVLGKTKTDLPNVRSNIWIAPDDVSLFAALNLPLSQWRLFLHPKQVEAVNLGAEQDLIITGGPGTGKTIALIHRAVRLAKTCKENQCVVLVAHSPETVKLMTGLALELNGNPIPSLHIVDMIAIGRDGKPRATDVFGPSASRKEYLQHLGKDVIALLIDEAQDIHGRFARRWLFGGRPEILTHLTIALDFNQNIFSDNRVGQLSQVFGRGRTIHLNYSYRIPREAGLLASNLLKIQRKDLVEPFEVQTLRNLSTSMTYGFSSDFIKVVTYDDVPSGIQKAIAEKDMLITNATDSFAIVFCGNSKHRAMYEELLKKIGYQPELKPSGIFTPRAIKGTEYDYCIVLAPELSIQEGANQYLALQGIYVALSRCRKGLSIYTNREFATMLHHPAVQFEQS